jgi:hypothetical protein
MSLSLNTYYRHKATQQPQIQSITHVTTNLGCLGELLLDEIDRAGPDDMIQIKTPLNSTGKAQDHSYFKQRLLAAYSLPNLNATFAPPPLQDSNQLGADPPMHSGTKYIRGHSQPRLRPELKDQSLLLRIIISIVVYSFFSMRCSK